MTMTKGTTPQSQVSLADQLDRLDGLAAQHGLYDAQDWLRARRHGPTPRKPVLVTMHDVHDFLIELGPCTIDELIAEDVFGVDEQALRTAVAGLVATGRATIDADNTVTPC